MHLRALYALLGPEGRGQVLFGSDFPNAPEDSIEYFARQLEESEELKVEDLRHALAIFPRLR